MVFHGIVTDRDPLFCRSFWKELFKATGTQLRMSSSYHPESDGQTEVLNRCLEAYLRCFVSEFPHRWAQWLAWAEYSFNTSFHSAISCTPFEAVYGRAPPSLTQFLPGEVRVQAVEQELLTRDEILKRLRYHLERAQQRMAHQANKHRRELEFQVGDRVFLKFRPYRQLSLFKRLNVKLAPRNFGPFEVVQRIGKVAYRLALPLGSKIHPIFHVSQLKAVTGDHPIETELPADLFDDTREFVPSQVLQSREVWRGDSRIPQVLVRWEGQSEEDATWVDEVHFRA